MSKSFKLYNLSFFRAEDFQPFIIDGYTFNPIPEKQPQRQGFFPANYYLKQQRKMHLNSRVSIPKKQKDSIFSKGGKYSEYRKIKFLDDLLKMISILIGKNVVPKFYQKFNEFPLCSAKHCEMVSKNSKELLNHLEIAVALIKKGEWQKKYDNGFHIIKFYNASNIYIAEPRFLADITIWEYLYYCSNRDKSYNDFKPITLNTKINCLVKEYLMRDIYRIPEDRLRVFSDMRNQLSHNGKFPIENPISPFRHLGWNECEKYLNFFKHLTQVLVLKTLGISAFNQMSAFDVKTKLQELVRNGAI